MEPAVVCTLSTINTIKDLKVFFFTLDLFNPVKPKVYLLCDTETSKLAPLMYKGQIIIDTGLDNYGTVNRKQMTNQRGLIYKTLWEDFMMEKATIMDIAFEKENAVFFFDSDICFLGQLPQIPENVKIGVSQHMIKPIDEDRYGKYNAGFMWTNDKKVPNLWRNASKTSRFYDQAALEDVVKEFQINTVHNFTIHNNYGWWRMYQSTESPTNLQKNWSMFRNDPTPNVGIRIGSMPLLSIHTHWAELTDHVTRNYNIFVVGFLNRLGKHPPAQSLLKFLVKEFPHLDIKN